MKLEVECRTAAEAEAAIRDGNIPLLTGAWGAGFVLAISRRWPGPERIYREARELRLGDVQFLEVEKDLFVANTVAQHGFPSAGRRCALDYEALAICLGLVAKFAAGNQVSVHMPRIGCGIAGGEWDRVAAVIAETLGAADVSVSVYDLAGAR